MRYWYMDKYQWRLLVVRVSFPQLVANWRRTVKNQEGNIMSRSKIDLKRTLIIAVTMNFGRENFITSRSWRHCIYLSHRHYNTGIRAGYGLGYIELLSFAGRRIRYLSECTYNDPAEEDHVALIRNGSPNHASQHYIRVHFRSVAI